jgi:proteasome lid subunit RPN8/RPN11
MPFRLEVPRALYTAMLEQARAELPKECCGLLAGRVEGGVGRVVARYPLVNELASPVEFRGEARGQFEACRDMRRQGIEELAIYHSHPTTAPLPSRKDRERNYSENVVNLIISLAGSEPLVRAWWLTATDYQEAEWKIID